MQKLPFMHELTGAYWNHECDDLKDQTRISAIIVDLLKLTREFKRIRPLIQDKSVNTSSDFFNILIVVPLRVVENRNGHTVAQIVFLHCLCSHQISNKYCFFSIFNKKTTEYYKVRLYKNHYNLPFLRFNHYILIYRSF